MTNEFVAMLLQAFCIKNGIKVYIDKLYPVADNMSVKISNDPRQPYKISVWISNKNKKFIFWNNGVAVSFQQAIQILCKK